jgi:membrane protease YdiL (CAAX protease family)
VVAAGVLLAAALLPAWRFPAFVAVVVAVAGAWGWLRRVSVALMAVLPVAVVLSWPAWLGADVPLGPAGCAEVVSVVALRRAVVLLVVALLAAAIASRGGDAIRLLGLRKAGAAALAVAALGGVAVAAGGLVIGPAVAEPFFGRLTFERPLAAIVPALVFGLANGLAEELAYRGILQGLLGAVIGRWPAIALQAVVFGISHVGPEVTDLAPVHAVLMAAAGLAAGLIVDRTRSLTIPIGIHIGADVALYVGLACRIPGA